MGFPQVYEAAALLQGAFTIWMLVDAYRRPAEPFWLWVILLVPGLGAWAYFFSVKAADSLRPAAGPFWQRKASLDELRYRAEQAPSLTNRLALAECLMERGGYAEAQPHLQAALKAEPEHCQTLFALAVCHLEQGRPEQARELLEQLVGRNPRWSDHAAYHLLIETRARCGDRPGALEGCRELVKIMPTLQHQCLLAEHLLAGGQADEARRLLDQGIRDYDFAPRFIRRRNRYWAGVARRLRKSTEPR
jgi:hypothetical protein